MTVDWQSIARHDAHKPGGRPREPWIMTMTWTDVFFAHWPIDTTRLRPHVPSGLEIDTYDGTAWLTVTPLGMANVGPRGLSRLPWVGRAQARKGVGRFLELNVRTYVRDRGGRSGIWFFSLDASNPIAVMGARLGYHLPYFRAAMRCEKHGEWFRFTSERRSEAPGRGRFVARYRPVGAATLLEPGSLDAWLLERYRLFSASRSGQLFRGEILHAPWEASSAEAVLQHNDVASRFGIDAPLQPTRLHYAARRDIVGWAPKRLQP